MSTVQCHGVDLYYEDAGEGQAIVVLHGVTAGLRFFDPQLTGWSDSNRPIAVVDCKTRAIKDIHCSMKQPHDPQVGWQVLTRNTDVLGTLGADKGDDWEGLRTKLRTEGITPLIPQRGPGLRGWARTLLIEDRAYHQRSTAESVGFGLRHRYGDTLWARTWFGQFRERVMKSAVHNIERATEGSPGEITRLNKAERLDAAQLRTPISDLGVQH